MGVINFSKANCKNCYKCVRHCPVKAIKIKNEQAEIVEDRCIACGQCLVICPQNARNIEGDLIRVKKAINDNKRVLVSLAPSFAATFSYCNEKKLVGGLKKLGFSSVEETAVGADIVTSLYKEYMEKNSNGNLITTCCPATNYLVEKYYPSLIKYMFPFVSPMIVHGKLLKQLYGEDSFVVFIGPCIAKKFEANDKRNDGFIDAVLSFEELAEWFQCENIDLNLVQGQEFNKLSSQGGKSYPIQGGILALLEKSNGAALQRELIRADGLEACIELFQAMENGEINNVCVEVNACKGSCIGGPGMIKDGKSIYARAQSVKKYVRKKHVNEEKIENKKEADNKVTSLGDSTFKSKESGEEGVNQIKYEGYLKQRLKLSKNFFDKSIIKMCPKEEHITKILKDMGKVTSQDELNCGVCGYNTCREKAQAIFEGMAETNMCLHFMRNKAESLTNIIFENTPNVIIMVDEDMRIKEFNPAAEEIFVISAENVKNRPLSTLIDDSDFIEVKNSGKNIIGKKVSYPQYNVVFIQNILYLKEQNVILATMDNIMAQEQNKIELMRVREKTLDAAQEVIEKQMRVAQEIASLLGETTAETKVTLTNLRKIVMGKDGEVK